MAEDDERRAEAHDHAEYDVSRLLALSDGVFAIAMTLLVLDLPVPQLPHPSNLDLLHALRGVVPNALAFAISFVLVGTYWVGHRNLLRGLARTDGALVWLNLFLLLLVCVVPFTAGLISHYGDLATAVIVYAANLGLLSLLTLALRLRTWRARLLAGPPSRAQRWRGLMLSVVGIVVFGGSIPIAVYSPSLAEQIWLLVFVAGLFGRGRRAPTG
jgi:uncharacterized membrane protein